jgi:hypothetical protein
MKNTGMLSLLCSAIALPLLQVPLSHAQYETHAVEIKALKHVVAPPLNQLVPIPPHSTELLSREEEEDETRSVRPYPSSRPVHDTVLQPSSDTTSLGLAALAATPGQNLLGLGTGFPGYSTQAIVPDTNGAVGPTQYVQYVNESFVVLNKSNGSVEYGPTDGNTLFQALGGQCAAHDNLDPIVQYDKLANRWVIMMPMFAAPFQLCVAVSSTSDAVNSTWNLYTFRTPGVYPDYPKLVVWPDGYYITYNQGLSSGYGGPAACVLNRANMLAGNAATMQCFLGTGTSYGAMLPADLDGTTAPATGTPEYFLSFDYNDQSLDVWQFHVNWTTPSASTFTGPTNIPVAAFTEPCGETVTEITYTTGDCIPQEGSSQGLDSYGDRLMYRVAYRNFGSYASLLANHTVDTGTGTQTGIRWYELRNSGSGFGVYQQGTYAPDSSYRWMGSLAMDKLGDIALGYSVSSSTMNPSIRYTGRLATDPLGQMESEYDVLSAAGVQNGAQSASDFHWGDYSSMVIDSTDDCTFWFTTEYEPTNGTHWSTRIASFSFPACTGSTTTTNGYTVINKASNYGNPLTSLSIPSTGSGHLIAVALMFNGGTSVSGVTDNAGNTYVSAGARATKGIMSTEIWYAVNSAAGATSIMPKFVGSPTHVDVSEWEVSGLSTAAPDATGIANGTLSADNTDGPAVTTSQLGDFIISVMFAASTNLTSMTTGNAFTDDFTTDGNGWARITSNTSSAGKYQASWYTASPSGAYCASTAAFLPAN